MFITGREMLSVQRFGRDKTHVLNQVIVVIMITITLFNQMLIWFPSHFYLLGSIRPDNQSWASYCLISILTFTHDMIYIFLIINMTRLINKVGRGNNIQGYTKIPRLHKIGFCIMGLPLFSFLNQMFAPVYILPSVSYAAIPNVKDVILFTAIGMALIIK